MTDTPGVAARDELAGVVDLFGALSRPDLHRALEELAFKAGTDVDGDAFEAAIDGAVDDYYLVVADSSTVSANRSERDNGGSNEPEYLTVGPAAFPALPPGAEDLPHILDVEDRTVDREALARSVRDRLEADAANAIDAGDDERMETLLDVCYDLEAWAPVETDDVREHLARVLDGD